MPFDQNTLESIASSLKAGHFSLLLGAGVSRDSKTSSGPLPSGDAFRQDLCRLKGARDNSPLQRVYATLTPAEIQEHVVERFRNCQPGPSVTKLTRFIWRKIFTFNIDDALERAYEAPGRVQAQSHFISTMIITKNAIFLKYRSSICMVGLAGQTKVLSFRAMNMYVK